jgi:hypothetical protein
MRINILLGLIDSYGFLAGIFPNFTLMIGSFIYGLITSELYGEIVAIIFVFFYNLWPTALFRQRIAQR